MPTRKWSRRGEKSVSTAINQQDDFRNLQGGTADLDKLITWLEDFDRQCNFLLLLVYKRNISIINLNGLSQLWLSFGMCETRFSLIWVAKGRFVIGTSFSICHVVNVTLTMNVEGSKYILHVWLECRKNCNIMLPNTFLQLWHNPSLGMTVTHEMMFMVELALNKYGNACLHLIQSFLSSSVCYWTCKKKTAKVIGKCI